MATEAPPSAPRPAAPGDSLDRFFHISERGSNVRTEIIAGLATFLTMSYILFVNPSIIAGLKDHTGHALQFQQDGTHHFRAEGHFGVAGLFHGLTKCCAMGEC